MSKKVASQEMFLSYADTDEDLRIELDKHLSLLQREGLVVAFHKRLIDPGQNWAEALDQQLNTASIILLLISADFLASEYCYGKEMKRALERHQAGESHVVPILLRPVDWQSAPFGKLATLPSNGQPVTSWSDRDDAFTDISHGIRSILQNLGSPSGRSRPFFKMALFLPALVFLEVLGLIASSYLTMVDPAENPLTPVSPQLTTIVGLFVILGLILLIIVTIDSLLSSLKRSRTVKKPGKQGGASRPLQ